MYDILEVTGPTLLLKSLCTSPQIFFVSSPSITDVPVILYVVRITPHPASQAVLLITKQDSDLTNSGDQYTQPAVVSWLCYR